MGRARPSGMRSVFLSILLSLVALGVRAQTQVSAAYSPLVQSIVNGSRITYGSTGVPLANMARTFLSGPVSGQVLVSEAGLLATPTGNAAITAARVVTGAALADALLPLAASAYVGFQAGSLLYNYLADSRVYPTPTGWVMDAGADPVAQSSYRLPGRYSPVFGASPSDVCNAERAQEVRHLAETYVDSVGVGAHPSSVTYNRTSTVVSSTPTQCTLHNKVTHTSNTWDGYAYNAGSGADLDADQGFPITAVNVTSCAASVDALNPAYSVPAGAPAGPDGKCRTGRYASVDPATAVAKIASSTGVTMAPQLAREVVSQGGVIAAPDAVVSGPATVTNPTPTVVTTTNPSTGATSSTTTYNTTNLSYVNNVVTMTSVTNTTNPDGTVTQTSAPLRPPQPQPEVCGLPGKPQCNVKVDESGTPSAVEDPTPKLAPQLELPKAVSTAPDSIFPAFPSLNWSFSLPTGCALIPLPSFAPYISSIDVCQFQSMFHDLMSVVWLVGGIFGAIQLFLRDALAA